MTWMMSMLRRASRDSRLAEVDQILVVAEQLGAVAGSLGRDVFAVVQEIAVTVRLLRADLFAHKKHRRAGRKGRQSERHTATRLGIGARSSPISAAPVDGARLINPLKTSRRVADLVVGRV